MIAFDSQSSEKCQDRICFSKSWDRVNNAPHLFSSQWKVSCGIGLVGLTVETSVHSGTPAGMPTRCAFLPAVRTNPAYKLGPRAASSAGWSWSGGAGGSVIESSTVLTSIWGSGGGGVGGGVEEREAKVAFGGWVPARFRKRNDRVAQATGSRLPRFKCQDSRALSGVRLFGEPLPR